MDDDFVLKADSADIPLPLRTTIESMLEKDPLKRISAQETCLLLTEYYDQAYPASTPLLGDPQAEETDFVDPEAEGHMKGEGPSRLRMSKDFFHKAGDL